MRPRGGIGRDHVNVVVDHQRLERLAARNARHHQPAAGRRLEHGHVTGDAAGDDLVTQPMRRGQLGARRVGGVELHIAAEKRHRIATQGRVIEHVPICRGSHVVIQSNHEFKVLTIRVSSRRRSVWLRLLAIVPYFESATVHHRSGRRLLSCYVIQISRPRRSSRAWASNQ